VKSYCIFALLVSALPTALPAQTETPPVAVSAQGVVSMSVDDVVTAALRADPEIQVAVRRLTLAKLNTTTARDLDDPVLMVRDWSTPVTRPWDLNDAQIMVALQQTFPNMQKRDMHARLAADDVNASAIELETLRNDVSAEARKLCSDLMRNADEMRVQDRQRSLLKEALDVALAQYTTGKVPQADVLRAQMALTRLNEQLIEIQEEREATQAQLNAMMGRRADEAFEISGTYGMPAALPSLEDLEQAALEHRPELAALRTQIGKSKDEGKLTRLAMKPDFTAAVGYMLMPTGSMARNAYMLEGSMNLPWLNRDRHDGEAKQADAATDVAQAELDARSATVFLEIRQAQIAVEAAQRRVKLYRDTLLPQAEASFKASTAAYQNNRAEFMSLIDAQNLLLDIQTAYYKASAAIDVGMAQLERAIGGPVEDKKNSQTERENK
jgi:outer membrane protein TolC